MYERLIEVEWDGDARTWRIYARSSVLDNWSEFSGEEGELDTLLSLARDVATGGS